MLLNVYYVWCAGDVSSATLLMMLCTPGQKCVLLPTILMYIYLSSQSESCMHFLPAFNMCTPLQVWVVCTWPTNMWPVYTTTSLSHVYIVYEDVTCVPHCWLKSCVHYLRRCDMCTSLQVWVMRTSHAKMWPVYTATSSSHVYIT